MAKPNSNLPCPTPQEIDNFNSRLQKDPETLCWNWTGRVQHGWGMVWYHGKSAIASRIAFLIHHGQLPESAVISQRCGNHLCCNPAHLIARIATGQFYKTGTKNAPRAEYKTITMQYHRRVMEIYLGRILRDDEVVHHINGNKRDNRIENLQVMSVEEHSRITNLGRKLSEELKQKKRQQMTGNTYAVGAVRSSEFRKNASIKLIGIKRSDETKKKMSAAQKIALAEHPRVFSEETRKKIGQSNIGKHSGPRKNHAPPTQETRNKISQALKGKKFSEERLSNIRTAQKRRRERERALSELDKKNPDRAG